MKTRNGKAKTIAQFAASLPDDYLECRARGYHLLEAYTVDQNGVRKGVRCWVETEVCRCGTKRSRGINWRNGRFVSKASYDHPDGYAGIELPFSTTSAEARGVFRLERAKRWIKRQEQS